MLSSFKYTVIVLLLLCPACAYAETTVALTTTVHADATPAEKKLAANLLALLEVETNQYPEIQVVERQQLDLTLHELVLSSSRNAATTLQLGNLAKADLILTAKILEPDGEGKQQVLVRITQAATAVIQGVTAVPISPVQIEEAAAEIANYLATTTAKGSKSQLPTIAILPFESVERFDRLRPLERGLRDLFTSALLQKKTCRVVQRSSMQQLLEELELVRAGLTENGKGLEDAPQREAVYVVRGEIDEEIRPTSSVVLLKVELVHVQSERVVAKVNKSCRSDELINSVAEILSEILQATSVDEQQPIPPAPNGQREIDRLFEMAARDVLRFIRKCPDDDGHYPLYLPELQRWQAWRGNIDAESDLGKYLLTKAIDRLESVLFIEPDRQQAAFLLAYCRSFHVEGVWGPKQCAPLLRRLLDDSSNTKMQKQALHLLADMYFRHRGGLHGWHEISQVDPALFKQACEHRLEVFANTPKHLRDWRWVRMLRIFRAVCEDPQQERPIDQLLQQQILTTIEKTADQPLSKSLPQETKDYLSKEIALIVRAIIQNRKNEPSLKEEAVQLLRRWTRAQDPRRRIVSAKTLYYFGKIPLEDCRSLIQSVVSEKSSVVPEEGWTQDILWLSKNLLKNDEPEAALSLLEKFKPNRNAPQDYHAPHQYGFTLGQCYEQLGRQEDALQAYMKYIELPAHYGSGLGFESRIRELGGVPLSKSRDIEVRYPEIEPGKTLPCKILATDGEHLYCQSGFERRRRGDPIQKIRVLDLESETWSTIDGPDDNITDLALSKGYLWAGTRNKGLWRMPLPNGTWENWTTDDGLPLNSVLGLVVHGQVAFVSVGNVNSHGHILSGAATRVMIEPNTSKATVEIYREKHAPEVAPSSMAIESDRLIACGQHRKIHALNLKSNQWTTIAGAKSSLVAKGSSGIWTLKRDSIASLLDAAEEEQKKFRAKGKLKDYPAGTYRPRFLLEHDGNLWVGGKPWRKFSDTGLFRLDLTTGRLKRYGAREGFRYAEHNDYECYDGVWAKDRLWVATSFGLAEVAMRDPTERDRKTLVRRTTSDAPMRKIRDLSGQGLENLVKTNSVKMQPKTKALGPGDRLNEKGFSQLHQAASAGNVKVAQALIDRGANIDIPQRTFHGTPLQYAASAGQAKMVELLLKHKATVDATDTRSRTPLMWAASEGHPQAAQLLIQAGADINKTTGGGWTPLHYAAQKGHLEVAQLLMKHGANLSKKNINGKTPLDLNPNIAPPQ